MRYLITHRTTYGYGAPAHESFNEVRLRPASDEMQTCLNFRLTIEPPAPVIQFDDYYGNAVHDFGIPYLHDRLIIEAVSDVVTFATADQPLSGPALGDPDVSPSLASIAADEVFADDHAEFLSPSGYVALEQDSRNLALALLGSDPGISAYGFLTAAATYIHENIAYEIGTTTVHTTVAEVLAGRSGVCQDFSHLLISICRHVGLPARYVSGYLGNVEVSAASHAWVEAFAPPYGWIGVDSTTGGLCTGRHVKIAIGRDYGDVSIVRGTYRGGGSSSLEVAVRTETIGDARGLAVSGTKERGKLVQYQTLGGLNRLRNLGSMAQSLEMMAQTTVRMGEGRGMLGGMPEQHEEGDVPRQQPQQQQQIAHIPALINIQGE